MSDDSHHSLPPTPPPLPQLATIFAIFFCSSINLLCYFLLQRGNCNPFLVSFFGLQIRLERERLVQLGGGKALMNEVKAEEEECRGGTGNGCWKLHQEKLESNIEEGGTLEQMVVDQKVEEQEAEQEDRQQQNELAQKHSAILAKSLASVAQTYHPQRFNIAHTLQHCPHHLLQPASYNLIFRLMIFDVTTEKMCVWCDDVCVV